MANSDNVTQNLLPQVLLLKRPPAFKLFGDDFFSSQHFRYLKAYESDLLLHEFLSLHAQSVQAILLSGTGAVSSDVLQRTPSVKVVVTTYAGLDLIDLDECRRREIVVTNVGSIGADDVADTAVGLLVDAFRKVSSADRFVRQKLWAVNGEYHIACKVSGKRIGIVGLGNIGSRVAKRLESFNCRISYNSRNRKSSIPYKYYSNVSDLAAENDALIICCPLTTETYHLINKKVLSALGKEGVVVNVARGNVIDEQELIRCLIEGVIKAAGLDVFATEPNVPKEFFELDNVVLSPHSATFTVETFKELQELVVGNLEAFFSNKPLVNVVGA